MSTCPTCRTSYPEDTKECPDDGDVLLPDEAFEDEEVLKSGSYVGEYRIDKQIGSGTFGDVFAAEHPLIGKQAATINAIVLGGSCMETG